jgi:hypothetical protein
MSVKITPFGPTQATLDEIARDVLRLTEVKKHLQKTRHRLLSVSLVESEAELKHSRLPATPSRFRATIYDYTNNRTLLVLVVWPGHEKLRLLIPPASRCRRERNLKRQFRS